MDEVQIVVQKHQADRTEVSVGRSALGSRSPNMMEIKVCRGYASQIVTHATVSPQYITMPENMT